ncbi:hypothetical protein PpBr36_07486 [Pyricularia pennisetigena]|uniref:hypothetical protein n=1 Tax=Pyricularia pennisetigena TaxID=1578925 RepID=UPI001150FD2E|nr:hypothetical protein PpBr36_07486 [Pyricularia pennisetigena]TLS25480.1 hypothetical protein PpBr36_07486 [Pyricularia pennisetigena]
MDWFGKYSGGTTKTAAAAAAAAAAGPSQQSQPPSHGPQLGDERNPQPYSSQGSTRMQIVIDSSPIEHPSTSVYDGVEDEYEYELSHVATTNLMPRAWKHASAGAMIPCGASDSATAAFSASKPGPKRSSRPAPPPQPQPQPQPQPSSSFDIPIPERKKRGRPKGWKPGMPYSTMSDRPTSEAAKLAREKYLRENPGVVAPAARGRPRTAAPKGPPKPRGRPPKKPPQTPRQVLDGLERRYVPFICEWKGCKAELQNMETLRRHVRKVHGRDEVCRWSTCVASGSTEVFGTNDEFIGHVERAHLVPFQWHMGFGYSNEKPLPPRIKSGEDAPMPAYLLDENGTQVTPWIRELEVEDQVTRLARRRKLRLALKWMNDEAPIADGDNSEEEASS